MRIAMVSEATARHAEQVGALAAALAAQGHDVTSRREDLEATWRGRRPDVVHTHSSATAPAAIATAIATAARYGIPVVHTFRPSGTTPLREAEAEAEVAGSVGRLTTTCGAHLNALVTAGVSRSHISPIPDGVDTGHFTPEGSRAERGVGHRLVALGEPVAHAGHSTAVAALPALPGTELVIPTPPSEALRRRAEELLVADRVRFIGEVSHADLPALLRSADIVVCTPWHEPCPDSVLAAMACGVAVVATAVGPLPDIVVDRVSGLLVPPRKPRLLADALFRLLNHRATREQYGASGCDRACARYAWPRIAAEMVRVYERAATATHPVRGRPIGARP